VGEVLQFKRREPVEVQSQPVRAPESIKLDITERECHHLDAVINAAIHVLDVVNAGPKNVRGFLAGEHMLTKPMRFQGREYDLLISLTERTPGPRIA
jgi:hypothetical protein